MRYAKIRLFIILSESFEEADKFITKKAKSTNTNDKLNLLEKIFGPRFKNESNGETQESYKQIIESILEFKYTMCKQVSL